jgi:hypothetical protein
LVKAVVEEHHVNNRPAIGKKQIYKKKQAEKQ